MPEDFDPAASSTEISRGDRGITYTDPGGQPPPASQPTTFLDRAWQRITGPPQPVINPAPGSNIERIREAATNPIQTYPSITRWGEQSPLTPEQQQSESPGVNLLNDTMGTVGRYVVGPIAAVGNTALTAGNEALRSLGAPEPLIRDLNVELTRRAGEGSGVPKLVPERGPYVNPRDVPAMRELTQPPTPSLPEVRRQVNAAAPPDPVTENMISLIKRGQGSAEMPPPPSPFTTPTPPARTPTGGLLDVSLQPQQPPGRGGLLGTSAMSAEDMLAQSQAHFAPVDTQIRQGATIPTAAADAVRGPLIDQIPTDPQKGVAVGETPLTKLGADYQGFQGQPMSYDAAVALDRRLTQERQAAASQKGGADLARQIGKVQDKVREAMDNIPDPGGGDTSALAQAKLGRQSYLQYRKQSQLEDIDYDASLLPEGKQDAYRRSRITALLRSDNQRRGWFPDELAALEQQLKAGNIGRLTNWGLLAIKPVSRAVGGGIGGHVFGPTGAIVGSEIGGDMGAAFEAGARRRLGGLDLGPVSQTLTTNMPPPPQGWAP